HKFVVITGVSGSGKSSLAFDTIYAEGQRRYVESLSSYARQFMEQMEKPQVDQITGLSPAIAIEQKTVSRNPRSTVGTVTEVLDYLRVLYARAGTPHCPQCGRAVRPQSAQQVSNQLAAMAAGTRFELMSPIARGRKGGFNTLLTQALKDGYTRSRVDGEMFDLTHGIPALDKNKRHQIELVIDRLVVPAESGQDRDFRSRLMDSVETTLRAGEGVLIVRLTDGGEEVLLSEHNACPVCELSFAELEPRLFSFNSPMGMCDECNGLGVMLQVDPSLIITKPQLSLLDGASPFYGNLRKKGEGAWTARNLSAIATHYGVDLNIPWNELPEHFRQVILYGSGTDKVRFEYDSGDGRWKGESIREVNGAVKNINRLFRQTRSEGSRRFYMQFMNHLACPKCQGERLCPEARFVTVGGKRLPEVCTYSIGALHEWMKQLPSQLDEEQLQISLELIQEIRQRLSFVCNVGLHYLTLDRPAPTLSGGEGQRIRLASQIGNGLTGVLYILDEPSIGLHTRDHRALLDTLIHLRDLGNTVLVVEHDAATMLASDWLIDLGPGPGILGGELIAEGTPEEVMANPDSLTGQYLSGKRQVSAPNGRKRRQAHGWLTLYDACLHNLRHIDARFPLGTMICVTGVSGSGKSSLISHTLYPALARELNRAQTATPGPHDRMEGQAQLNKVINITQEPIGRNPRSNPGTYVGALDEIRKVFAGMPEARALGYGAGRFSFNVKGGRCEACAGYGFKKVEMHFLPDVWVTCKECAGKRFNHQTLDILYKGKNIAEVLDMDVQQALEFFSAHPAITRILQTLQDVGLNYIKLGQSALTLSGGEAQRVKLAKELSGIATGKTIYILDEPTTGLHFADIQHLLDVLHRLVDAGNTVIIIEHNQDVIKTADWVIDMGPDGGDGGGKIVAEGMPEEIMTVPESYTGYYLKEVL
ncbi:MAG TPA: excinuclease ABC subunit UvrA, partial [Anaerolineaceae bacterium]|nr:excinuclease ABC subunit UvrA [Anaerolineaceae bacterium]